jgi:hypothetical protein
LEKFRKNPEKKGVKNPKKGVKNPKNPVLGGQKSREIGGRQKTGFFRKIWEFLG